MLAVLLTILTLFTNSAAARSSYEGDNVYLNNLVQEKENISLQLTQQLNDMSIYSESPQIGVNTFNRQNLVNTSDSWQNINGLDVENFYNYNNVLDNELLRELK